MNEQKMKVIPIAISLLAFFSSVLALYFAQLRPAKLQIVAGEHLNIGYYDEGNLNITLPISFVNEGARSSTIRRVALLIQRPGSQEGYLLEPLFYQRINEKGDFLHESMPVPVTVAAKQSIVKQVLFRSSFERPGEFQLVDAGTYNLKLIGWTEDSIEPRVSDSFSIILSDNTVTSLKQCRANKKSATERIPQSTWRKWAAHHLTEVEVKALR